MPQGRKRTLGKHIYVEKDVQYLETLNARGNIDFSSLADVEALYSVHIDQLSKVPRLAAPSPTRRRPPTPVPPCTTSPLVPNWPSCKAIAEGARAPKLTVQLCSKATGSAASASSPLSQTSGDWTSSTTSRARMSTPSPTSKRFLPVRLVQLDAALLQRRPLIPAEMASDALVALFYYAARAELAHKLQRQEHEGIGEVQKKKRFVEKVKAVAEPGSKCNFTVSPSGKPIIKYAAHRRAYGSANKQIARGELELLERLVKAAEATKHTATR